MNAASLNRREKDSPVRITVIILTFNQRDTTLELLESLSRLDHPAFDVLVWDNGSDDGTVPAIEARFPRVLAHRHSQNLGVASGRNAAAALAAERFDSTHFLFLDNDILPARAVGMTAIFLKRGPWGRAHAAQSAAADICVETLVEIPETLERVNRGA